MVRSMSLLVALSVSAPALAFGYGEAGAAKQSLPERALHFHTDRLRVDPGAADSTFDDLPAVRPLILADELAAAARFYAEDMAANGCFPADHSSCDGTSFSARVGSFYSSLPIGENIARGQPTAEVAVFDSWLYSDGHRANMLDADWNEIGTGHPVETPDNVWVQDFGGRAGSEEPIITSAIHAPLLAAPDDVITFFAAAYDPDGASLRGVTLVAEDACHFMDPDLGSDGMETWAVDASVSAEAGCFKYWLAALRAHRWPSRRLPVCAGPVGTVTSNLVRQVLFARVFAAILQSRAAEHAERLTAMQAAERSIGDKIDELRKTHQLLRQEVITAELLDIIGGYEAASQRPEEDGAAEA